ncbi:hypothetical protein [Halocola ammonii]
MKVSVCLLFITLLSSGFAIGQQGGAASQKAVATDSLETKKIEQLVETIRQEKTLEQVRIDSVELTDKFSNAKELYKADVYLTEGEIVRIYLSPRVEFVAVLNSFGQSSIDYFLKDQKLIYIHELYADNSRPGSCGWIEMRNELYFNDGELVETRANDNCYQSKIEVDWLLHNFEKMLMLSKEEID